MNPARALPIDDRRSWVDFLDEEDLAFLKRFILASGSLKAVAEAYGISYPTVRARLDRLIAKVQIIEKHSEASAFERLLRAKYAEGKLDMQTLKTLLTAHKQAMEQKGRSS
jgi:hypothetical protein